MWKIILMLCVIVWLGAAGCSMQKDCSDYIETFAKKWHVNEAFYSSIKKSCVVYYETKLKIFVEDAWRKSVILSGHSEQGCKTFHTDGTQAFSDCMFAIDDIEKEAEKLK